MRVPASEVNAMSEQQGEPIHVVIAMDYSDSILDSLRAISPRLRIERHFPTVPERAWAEAEVLYTLDKFPQPAQAPRLRWIQLHTAGIDHIINEPIMQAQDVEVTTASGVHTVQMAEFCLGMILAFNIGLPRMFDFKTRAEWPQSPRAVFAPRELRGQTLGIVGYGSVGRELARMADALGMKVLAVKRDVMHPAEQDAWSEPGTGDPQGEIPLRIYPPEAVAAMAAECDYLALITPLTKDTHHMINAEVFNRMKRTAVLINVARGSVVDEEDLVSALAAGKIAGAALDVFEEEPLPKTSPLWNFDNVIISPHVAGYSSRYHEKTAAVFAENLNRYLNKRPLLNRVKREYGY